MSRFRITIASLLVVVLLVAVLTRRAFRRATVKAPTPTLALAATPVTAAVATDSEELAPSTVRPLDAEQIRVAAHAKAAEDPATAALVLRFWLGSTAGEADDLARAKLGVGTPVA